jgi:hypothetical protein
MIRSRFEPATPEYMSEVSTHGQTHTDKHFIDVSEQDVKQLVQMHLRSLF